MILISLLVGYTLRPLSMMFAQWITKPMFKLHKKTRRFQLKDLNFPYNKFFSQKPYYRKILKIIQKITGCPSESLPGNTPFAAAKRYLRLTAPALWEESERMEAEVRLIGAILLAAIYSTFLSLFSLLFQYKEISQNQNVIWLWFCFSVIAVVTLSEGYNRLRFREVSYTYLNTLLASKNENTSTSE